MIEQMHGDELNQLRETLFRRELREDEQEALRRHLDAQAQDPGVWAEDVALSRLLARLPDAPRPSNFTAQVLQAVELEPCSRRRGFSLVLWWAGRRPAIRLATSLSCLLLVFVAYAQYQALSRARLATSIASVVRSVEAASAVAQLPPVEILRDFEAIRGLSQSRVAADEELLVALRTN